MDIVDRKLDEYLHKISPTVHGILREMEEQARLRNFPIVGPLVGRVLFQYARLLNAKRILELGSGYGYSAFWWAVATQEDASIICTEGSGENIAVAEQYFNRAGLWHKIVYYRGDAVELLDEMRGEFDIIFMDIDKHQYPEAFQKAFPQLRSGGLFITDNVLWSGKIVTGDTDRATQGVLQYNHLIYNTPGAFSSILPLRDGVAVTLKL